MLLSLNLTTNMRISVHLKTYVSRFLHFVYLQAYRCLSLWFGLMNRHDLVFEVWFVILRGLLGRILHRHFKKGCFVGNLKVCPFLREKNRFEILLFWVRLEIIFRNTQRVFFFQNQVHFKFYILDQLLFGIAHPLIYGVCWFQGLNQINMRLLIICFADQVFLIGKLLAYRHQCPF